MYLLGRGQTAPKFGWSACNEEQGQIDGFKTFVAKENQHTYICKSVSVDVEDT